MLKLDFDDAAMDIIAAKIAEKAFEKLKEKMDTANQWPPLLTRDQLKDFLGIKDTKASELLNRADFPVIREFGRPKVPTHMLMKWIEEHTEWMDCNSNFFDRAI
ncbi:hypothetical protein [Fictibacillus gelatini]|uniref:hypothetical protein n=1 Tax=Fictibacillus gelatini TaxID=225985 RepID=UPI0003FAFE41|nr:hypothetical protein [Fictibacillus gelatini]